MYEPDAEVLSGFLYTRFRPEFKVAVDAWLQTRPGIDPDAPPTPFVMPEYELEADERSADLEREAEAFAADARQANQRSDNYVLMTIMLATVLFCAGISSKMDTARARLLLLGVGLTLLVVSIGIVASFPMRSDPSRVVRGSTTAPSTNLHFALRTKPDGRPLARGYERLISDAYSVITPCWHAL